MDNDVTVSPKLPSPRWPEATLDDGRQQAEAPDSQRCPSPPQEPDGADASQNLVNREAANISDDARKSTSAHVSLSPSHGEPSPSISSGKTGTVLKDVNDAVSPTIGIRVQNLLPECATNVDKSTVSSHATSGGPSLITSPFNPRKSQALHTGIDNRRVSLYSFGRRDYIGPEDLGPQSQSPCTSPRAVEQYPGNAVSGICAISRQRAASLPLPGNLCESPRGGFAGRVPCDARTAAGASGPSFAILGDRSRKFYSSLPSYDLKSPPNPYLDSSRPRTAGRISQAVPMKVSPQRPGRSLTKEGRTAEDKSSGTYLRQSSQSWTGDWRGPGTSQTHLRAYRARFTVTDRQSPSSQRSSPERARSRAKSASPPRVTRPGLPRPASPRREAEPDEHMKRIARARSMGKIQVRLEAEIEEAREKAAEKRRQNKLQLQLERRKTAQKDKDMYEKISKLEGPVTAHMKHDKSIQELRSETQKNNKELQDVELQRQKQMLKMHMQRIKETGPAVWGNSYLSAEEREALRQERLEKLDKERYDKRGKEDLLRREANNDLKNRLQRVVGKLIGTNKQAERQDQVAEWTKQAKMNKLDKQLVKMQEATTRELYRRYIKGKITATDDQAKRWAEVAYSSRHKLMHTPATQL